MHAAKKGSGWRQRCLLAPWACGDAPRAARAQVLAAHALVEAARDDVRRLEARERDVREVLQARAGAHRLAGSCKRLCEALELFAAALAQRSSRLAESRAPQERDDLRKRTRQERLRAHALWPEHRRVEGTTASPFLHSASLGQCLLPQHQLLLPW